MRCLLDTQILVRSITLIDYAMTTNPTRYALNGALFALDNNGMFFVATDGHRLSEVWRARKMIEAKSWESDFWKDGRWNGVSDEMLKSIVPSKAVRFLKLWLRKEQRPIELIHSMGTKNKQTRMFFRIDDAEDDAVFGIGLIEGKFPNWKKVIPKRSNTRRNLVVSKQELEESIRRLNAFGDSNKRAIAFSFPNEKEMQLTIRSSSGEVSECVAIDSGTPRTGIRVSGHELDSDEYKIGFDGLYVLDFLKALGKDAEQVRVSLGEKNEAGLFLVADDQKEHPLKEVQYTVMPLILPKNS